MRTGETDRLCFLYFTGFLPQAVIFTRREQYAGRQAKTCLGT